MQEVVMPQFFARIFWYFHFFKFIMNYVSGLALSHFKGFCFHVAVDGDFFRNTIGGHREKKLESLAGYRPMNTHNTKKRFFGPQEEKKKYRKDFSF